MRSGFPVHFRSFALVAAAGLMAGLPGFGHHSFAAELDGNKPMRIEGILSRIEWTNPHSYFYIDVKDDAGNLVRWGCEGANPGQLSRRGFKRGDIKLGDKLIVDGYAAKDGSHLLDARRIYLNGKAIFGGSDTAGGPGAQCGRIPVPERGRPSGRPPSFT